MGYLFIYLANLCCICISWLDSTTVSQLCVCFRKLLLCVCFRKLLWCLCCVWEGSVFFFFPCSFLLALVLKCDKRLPRFPSQGPSALCTCLHAPYYLEWCQGPQSSSDKWIFLQVDISQLFLENGSDSLATALKWHCTVEAIIGYFQSLERVCNYIL